MPNALPENPPFPRREKPNTLHQEPVVVSQQSHKRRNSRMQPTWKDLPFLSITLLLCTALVALFQNDAVQAASHLASLSYAPLSYNDPSTTIFINEFHYDDSSDDDNEFIEVAGPVGTNLTGWNIVLYNGSNGTTYDSDAL